MSARHDDRTPAVAPSETRAHAHHERQRVKSSLAAYAGRSAEWADEVDEPGVAFKPRAERDATRRRSSVPGREYRHWKLAFWKRRSVSRRARAAAQRTGPVHIPEHDVEHDVEHGVEH